MVESYFDAIKRSFDFRGRTSRKQFFLFVGFHAIIYFVLCLLLILCATMELETALGVVFGMMIVYWFFAFFACIAIQIRRIHDVGYRWYYWLIPIYGVVLIFFPGEQQENEFGLPVGAGSKSGARRFCPHCGNKLAAVTKFCGNCGKIIELGPSGEPEKKEMPKNKICPNCSQEYPLDMMFCEKCGHKLT